MTRSCWLFARQQYTQGSARGGGFEILKKESSDGQVTMVIRGSDANVLKNEVGGHRWQRIPPTEKGGRVHTSTITVTALELSSGQKNKPILDPDDVEEMFMRGSGKGGQHRNKTDSACRLKHIPTGIIVRCENERRQAQNREAAWKELERRLRSLADAAKSQATSRIKQEQAGTGMRGDKRRTWREKDDVVTDHISGKKSTLSRVVKGELELLW